MNPTPREVWTFETRTVGRRVEIYESLPSTNDYSLESTEPGTAVMANHQTAGRGRQGSIWQSAPGQSLLMSATVAPPDGSAVAALTAWAAVAVAEAIFELTTIQARIKWPNDLLLRGKKVCGILTEVRRNAVVGIGLNLTQTASELAGAGLPDATSLLLATGVSCELTLTAKAVLRKLDAEYKRLHGGGRAGLESDWAWRIGLLGKPVFLELTDGDSPAGRLKAMNFDAVELDTGKSGPLKIAPERIRRMSPL